MTAATASTFGERFAERSITAAGFDLRYWDTDPSTDPAANSGGLAASGTARPPELAATLVWLHGAGGPRGSRALDLLAERYRVIALELPGWGAQPTEAPDFDALAEQVAEAIAAIGVPAYHLIGTSLGGACALHLTTLHPDRVISLTLEAPAKFRVDSLNPATATPEQMAVAFRTHPERLPHPTPPDPEFMQRVWPTVERLMGSPEVDETFLTRLADVRTRVLILFGHSDGLINPKNGPIYRRALPNGILCYVYDAAHDIQADRPEAFADVVGDFVRRGLKFLVNEQDGLINP